MIFKTICRLVKLTYLSVDVGTTIAGSNFSANFMLGNKPNDDSSIRKETKRDKRKPIVPKAKKYNPSRKYYAG